MSLDLDSDRTVDFPETFSDEEEDVIDPRIQVRHKNMFFYFINS